MVASISLTIKTGILVAIMVSVYFSMSAQVDASEKTKNYLQLKDVAMYVESKMLQGMETVNVYGSNSTQLLLLPNIGVGYAVGVNCNNNILSINASSDLGRYYIIQEFVDCNRVSASGNVYYGQRCLTVERINETKMNIDLVNDCGFI